MTEYNPDDYSNYRIQKAKETIGEVENHILNEFWTLQLTECTMLVFMQ